MDYKVLMQPEVLEIAKAVWLEHPSWAKDKRKGWALALGRIRKLLMEVRTEERRKERELHILESTVEEARNRIQQDDSIEAREEFEESLMTLRKKEQKRAEQLRRNCLITWLKEVDASSKYFFARLRAKHANEEMTTIEGDTGTIIEDQKDILEEIIAKRFAIRLKEMLPRLIDTQQIGFVAGRNIIDNILCLRLGQELAQTTDQEVIFVKLDFMKAYDRVAHGFLWATLAAMGMGEATITRIKGLVEDGRSEVHINGDFTEDILVGRGVRQGCPLAPLLFATMTTQPLMLALREEERIGNIQGLNIGGGRTLLHQLLVDDTGICITAVESQFNRLEEVIGEFEGASGACLNLQKSIMMQLRPRETPTWLEQSSCKVAEPGKHFLYMGVLTSSPIDEGAIAAEIVQKMMQKLKHWSNKLLSWPAKTILLKHVLAATPLYQLLSVGLCKDGLTTWKGCAGISYGGGMRKGTQNKLL
ncbi:hypothetical protein R1sor_016825 [Riccia sorocarpa]|uniref:Reverse transcriptase domain-containing protein n=1 Tax=Riccia sorocarpa TaxID=122646 RepID=A0ABD3HI40_9MARC